MAVFIMVKSVVLGVLAVIIDVAFIKAMLLVITSGIVTGVFGIIVAHIQAKADERQHRRLDYLEARITDVAGAVGANKRTTDPDARTPPSSPETRA